MAGSTIRVACGTDNGIDFTDEHFGSAKYYLIYELDPKEKTIKEIEERQNTSVEEKVHGDPEKAKSVSELLSDTLVLVSFVMGPNIVKMRKKFVPVISRTKNIKEALERLLDNVEDIERNINAGENKDREIIYLHEPDSSLTSIKEALNDLKHPEINNSLVELGMIGDITKTDEGFEIELKLPFLEVPIKQMLTDMITQHLLSYAIKVVPTVMADEERENFMTLAKENWSL